MKRRLISWLLAIVMLFSLLPAVTTQAGAAQITQVGTIDGNKQHINGLILNAGTIYKVIGNSNNSCSVSNTNTVETGTALEIRGTETSPTVLYIPKGVVLDVKGGPTHPGIQLEENNMLIVTGGGTLTVTGGDAENGSRGQDGGNGKSGEHGYGGRGGNGGRGAGAGIGLRGQDGGSGGPQTGTSGGGGEGGKPGKNADYVQQTMGTLIVIGDTTVNAYSGNPGKGGSKSSGGSGVRVSGTDQSGGGGGGAGGGGSVGYGIGGGGIGGGGGGAGGSGKGGKHTDGAEGSAGNDGWSYTLGNDPDAVSDANQYSYGHGGSGGNGGGGDPDTNGGGQPGAAGSLGLPRAGTTSKLNYINAKTEAIPEHGVIEVSTADYQYPTNIHTHSIQPLYSGNDPIVTQVAGSAINEGWVPENIKYTITLNANASGDKVSNRLNNFTSESKTVWLGHTTIPNANDNHDWYLERTGYKLKGYYDSATGGTQYYDATGKALTSTAAWGKDKRYSKAGDLTLYAQWEPVTAKVTFDPNGGVGSIFSATWTYGQTPASLATSKLPKNTGYTFSGYFEGLSGGSAIVNAVGAATKTSTYIKDTTLYARWTPIKYRIQFYGDDGSTLLGSMNDVVYNNLTLPGADGKVGSKQVLTSTLSKSGHVFLGWSTVPGLSTAMYEANKHYTVGLADTQNATVRLFPAWRMMEEYTITYDANGGTGAPTAETAREDNTGHKLAAGAPTRDGYTFLGWATTPVATKAVYQPGKTIAKVTADLTLYAVWQRNPSVTYDANGGYFTQSMPIDYPSPEGTYTLTNVVPVREGYTFAGWACGGKTYKSGDAYDLNGSYADITFTAVWKKAQYTLTLESPDVTLTFDEPTSSVQNGNKYPYGTEFVFTAAGNGTVRVYVNNVLISPQDDGKYHFTMTQDTTVKTTLTAIAPEYIVSYDPNGGVNAPFDRTNYPAGSTVTVKGQDKMSRTGYTFTGWHDKDGNDVGSSFTITDDTVLTAQWSANTYHITYDANGGGGGMIATDLKYDQSGILSKGDGLLRDGYDFAGWSWIQNGLVAYLGGETVKNLTDKAETLTLYAVWTPKEYTMRLDTAVPPQTTPQWIYLKATYGAPFPSLTMIPSWTGHTFLGFYG